MTSFNYHTTCHNHITNDASVLPDNNVSTIVRKKIALEFTVNANKLVKLKVPVNFYPRPNNSVWFTVNLTYSSFLLFGRTL
mmetsp:Transcript_19452/g.33712  ORF Transcript_19452/g.33712 Transcript_19452/m.33712 type:complete len:81 (+) Transcript_19452:1342-1584(+)